MARLLIHQGNKKLGSYISHFSLPALATCPGKTHICARRCYALQNRYRFKTTQASLAFSHTVSKSSYFVQHIALAIRNADVHVLRLHPSGDFYSVAYIKKWYEIASRFPCITFYGYTRSWADPKLAQELCKLAELSNVFLWWSVDNDSPGMFGKPPFHSRVKTVYMAVNYDDKPPLETSLIFRVKRRKIVRYLCGKLVCPAENGMSYPWPWTCSRCKMCYAGKPIPEKKVS